MERLVLEGKKDRAKKRQLNEENGNPYGTPRGDADENDVEVEEEEPFTNPITPTTTSRKGKEQDKIFKQCDAYKDSRFDFGYAAAIRNREKMSLGNWWDRFGNGTLELKKLAIRILSQCISASGCERHWSIFEHIHSPKRNRLQHQRLNDLVFVHYNLKLRERDMLKRTGNAASDPISLENINILADWVAEEAPLLTIEDVDSWTAMEQPAQMQEGIPDFDGGDEIGGPIGEDLGANEDDNHYYSDA
ncbi:hypothetical protein MRB53_028436 [Persea americana]|uniref:Uncharacterized protein n=1 Tax=Persea americana TaxID=3435 RepID=A0ACC2KFZ4_PERAE|nr:hypothetical protein MRB53_028436 [Persea americana]